MIIFTIILKEREMTHVFKDEFKKLKEVVLPNVIFRALISGSLEEQRIRIFLPEKIKEKVRDYYINEIDSIAFNKYRYFKKSNELLLVINCNSNGKLKYGISDTILETEDFYFEFIAFIKVPKNFDGNLQRSFFYFTSSEKSLKQYLNDFKFSPILL